MSVTRDSEPHVIVVEKVDHEEGLIDWHVEHNDTCTYDQHVEEWSAIPVRYYTCGVQWALDNMGLEPLATALNLDSEYDLTPGPYTVIGVYEHNYYAREFDFWLETAETDRTLQKAT